MKILNSLIKGVVFFTLFLSTTITLDAQINLISINSSSSRYTCSLDTIQLTVSNGGTTSNNHTITVGLPNGYEYLSNASGLSNVNNLGGGNYQFDIDNLVTGNNTFEIYSRVSCGAFIADNYSFEIFDGSNTSVFTTNSNSISLSRPNLIIEGTQNTNISNQTVYLNGSTIDLSNLRVRDTIERKYKIKLTSSNTRVDSFSVRLEPIAYRLIGVSHNANIVSNGNDILLNFNQSINAIDSIEITDTIVITKGCISPTNSSIASAMKVLWGCGGSFCDSTNYTFNANQAIPAINFTLGGVAANGVVYGHLLNDGSEKLNSHSLCNTNFYETVLKNNADLSRGNNSALYDVRLFYGLNSSGNLPGLVDFDSVFINNVRVDTLPQLSPGYRPIDTLTASNYTGGGFVDLDDDGRLNDLLPGDSVIIRFYYTIKALQDSNPNCIQGHHTYWRSLQFVEAKFNDVCDNPTSHREYQNIDWGFQVEAWLVPPSFSSVKVNDSIFNLIISEPYRDRLLDDSKVILKHQFIVPNYVVLNQVNSSNIPSYAISSVTIGDSTIYTLSGNNIGFGRSSDVQFLIDCSLKTEKCSNTPFPVFGKSFITLTDEDGNECYTDLCNLDGSLFIQDLACNPVESPFNIIDTLFERATFGYTDSTFTTKVDRNTPGVNLQIAHNFDSLKNYIRFTSRGTSATDSLFLFFNYQHPFTVLSGLPVGFNPISLLNTYGNITITDQGTNTKETFIVSDFTPYIDYFNEENDSTGVVNYIFNFSAFIDSMRSTAAGSNFLFGGDQSSSIYSVDTFEIEMFYYGNQQNETFEITPQIQLSSSFTPNPNANLGFCNVPFSLKKMDVYHYTMGNSLFYRNNTTCNDFAFESRHCNSGDQGSNIYFPEFRIISRLDSMIYSWDSKIIQTRTEILYKKNDRCANEGGSFAANPTLSSTYRFTADSLIVIPEDDLWYSFRKFDYRVELIPTCLYSTSPEAAMHRYLSGNNYIDGIGGPFRYLINTQQNPGGTVYTGSPQALSPITVTPSISNDTACWIAELEHIESTTGQTLNNWVSFEPKFSRMNIFEVRELDPSNNVVSTYSTHNIPSGGLWVELDDTLRFGERHRFQVCAQVDLCGADSIIIRSAYNCSEYPDTSTFRYTGEFTCISDKTRQITLTNNIPAPFLENELTIQPTNPVDACDTLDYTLRVANIGIGTADSIKINLSVPDDTNNVNVLASSSQISFPSGNSFVTINDPLKVSNDVLSWDLSNIFNTTLPLDDRNNNPNNEFLLSFKVILGCPISNNSQIAFQIEYDKFCGGRDTLSTLVSNPIEFNGVSSINKTLDLSNVGYSKGLCSVDTVSVQLDHLAGVAVGDQTFIRLIIDSSYNSIDTIGGTLSLLDSVLPHRNYILSDKRYLEYKVANGFSFNNLAIKIPLVLVNDSIQCNDVVPFEFRVSDAYDQTCAPARGCVIYQDFDTISGSLINEKSNYSINNLNANYDLCTDSMNVSFDITVNDFSVLDSNITFEFVSDNNNNGIFDNQDSIINYSQNPPFILEKDSTYTFSYTFAEADVYSLNICNLMLRIDSLNSCSCSEAVSTVMVMVDERKDTTFVNTCSVSATTLGVCIEDTSNTVITWIPITTGADTLLSSTSLDSVVFTPRNDTPDTVIYRISIDRGNGCVSYDSVWVIKQNSGSGISCQDTTIYLNTLGMVSIDSSYVINPANSCPVDSVRLSSSSFDCSNTGVNSVTVYYYNGGNVDSCTSQVTVLDTLAPSISCIDTTVYLVNGTFTMDTSFVFNSANDICGVDSIWINPTTYNCMDTGNQSVWIFARDSSGNLDSCMSNVSVLDTTSIPSLCKDTTIYLSASGTFTIDTSFVINSISISGCNTIDSIWITDSLFDCGRVGANMISVYYRLNNNIDSCTSTVTVIDSINPQAICMDTIIYLDASGMASIDSSYIDNGSFDSCSVQTITLSKSSFDCSDVGINTITMIVTDANGNIDSCTSQVTVLDTIIPVISCTDTTVYLMNGTFTIDTGFVLNSASDICGLDSVWINPTTYNCMDTGNQSVWVFARDSSGNIDSCMSNVRVLDTTSITSLCKDTTIYLSASGTFTIDTSFVINTISTNGCNTIDSVWITDSSFNCGRVGTNMISVYYRINSNIDSCMSTVTVIDSTSPQAICMDTAIYLDASGMASIDSAYIDNGSNDSCSIQTITLSKSSFNCNDIGINTITMTVTDANGNIDSCNATVTVADTNRPMAVCQDITVQLDANGSVQISATDIDNGSSHICYPVSISLNDSTFTCADTGINNVTLYVRAPNGQIDSCTATVTVEDNTIFMLSCPPDVNDTVQDQNCVYTVQDYTSLVVTNDNCTPSNNILISQSPAPNTTVTSSNITVQPITITAIDTLNNDTLQCTFNLVLECDLGDILVPEFISPNGDDKNDKLVIRGIENFPNNRLRVYNRWGALVYEQNGYNNQWDGKANTGVVVTGDVVADGTYYYVLDLGIEDRTPLTGYIQVQP